MQSRDTPYLKLEAKEVTAFRAVRINRGICGVTRDGVQNAGVLIALFRRQIYAVKANLLPTLGSNE
jgi:hypothetical protein